MEGMEGQLIRLKYFKTKKNSGLHTLHSPFSEPPKTYGGFDRHRRLSLSFGLWERGMAVGKVKTQWLAVGYGSDRIWGA
jgi:hypothetical protein